MTAIWNLTKRKIAYAFVATAFLIFVSLSLAQPSDRTRFVYLISGQAAAGLQVTVVTHDGKTLNYTTDATGHVTGMAKAGKLTVADPVTGIRLIDQMLDKPTTEFKVPLPIRVRGTVSGFGKNPAAITIDCGYGPRLTVADYQRQVHGLPLVPLPDENKLEGMEMPRVPSKWVRSNPNTRGRFVTGWFAAVDAPELLVFNDAGQTAVRTVPLPKGVRARQTIFAGLITPAAGATLEITVEAGNTDLPLGLMMAVKSIGLRGSARSKMAQMISHLNRRDPAIGQFLSKRRQIPLELEGATKVTGLPPLQSLSLQFVGPVPGIAAERTVTLPRQGIVRIRLTEDELLGKREPLVPLTGIVRVEQGGPPVKGATVVYSSYPFRHETTTDENGRFTFPRVAANRGGVVLIDAPNPQAAPPFDRITVTRPVAPLPRSGARGSTGEQVFEIPRTTSGAKTFVDSEGPIAARAPESGSLFTKLEDFVYDFPVCRNAYTQDELQYVTSPVVEAYLYQQDQLIGPMPTAITSANVESSGLAVVNMTFSQPGTYMVFIQYTPFVWDAQMLLVLQPAASALLSPKRNMTQLTLSVIGRNGIAVPADVEVDFPGWPADVDPYETLTDNAGQLTVFCVSRGSAYFRNLLLVEVNDPIYGCYDGFVTLPEDGATGQVQVRLGACN